MPPAAHVFVADLQAPEIDEDDRHHLQRVLRLRPGELVTVADGNGGLRACRFKADGGLEPDGDIDHLPAASPVVTIGFALTKGERPEWVVQKLTEVGVDRIVPFVSRHTVVRWDPDKAARNVDRWRRVAREAAMQSRRRFLPEVSDVVELSAVEGALAHPGGRPPSLETPTVLVGPEGGWAEEELAPGQRPLVDLGATNLRAETAAVVAGALLCALRSGLLGTV